jgi:predicted Zn-dependent protease
MRLVQIKPTDEELRVILEIGFALRYARRLDEAADLFRGIVELLPEADVPRVALATVEIERGNYAAAQAGCEEALRTCPNSSYARVHRAEALLFLGQRSEAENDLNAIISSEPESANSRTARALLQAADLISPNEGLEASASSGRS